MEIDLTLTVDKVNAILAALGQRPFVEVVDLIAEIKQQAQEQLQQPNPEDKPNGDPA